MGNFRPVLIKVERGTVLLYVALGTHLFPGPALVGYGLLSSRLSMILARPVAILALHIYKMGCEIDVHESAWFVEAHYMALNTLGIERLFDRLQVFKCDGMFALHPDFMLFSMAVFTLFLTNNRTITGLALFAQLDTL